MPSRNFVPGEEGDIDHAPAEPPKDAKKEKGKKVRFGCGADHHPLLACLRELSAQLYNFIS